MLYIYLTLWISNGGTNKCKKVITNITNNKDYAGMGNRKNMKICKF
jgi:hypothetical protein